MKERRLFGSVIEVVAVDDGEGGWERLSGMEGEVGVSAIADGTKEAKTRWVGVREWLCWNRRSLLLSNKPRLG
jgi:hypothetical protein